MNLTYSDAKALIKFCEGRDIKALRIGNFSIEFYPQVDQMKFDPQSLAKTLSDSMPPDSQMLFASGDSNMDDKVEDNGNP